jgi:hypothetical protein
LTGWSGATENVRVIRALGDLNSKVADRRV